MRDYVSPEAWMVLHRLGARLEALHVRARRARRRGTATRECVQTVLAELNCFLATAERTMLHDAGWQFVRIGLHLERAIMTCSALRHLLSPDAPGRRESSAAGSDDCENPALSALLRMLGSQDAYRRLYQAHAMPRLVADLFLAQPDAPRSVYHCLLELQMAFDALLADQNSSVEPAGVLEQIIAGLDHRQLDSAAPSGAPAKLLEKKLNELLDQLLRLAQIVNDHHFSHQARIPEATDQQAQLQL